MADTDATETAAPAGATAHAHGRMPLLARPWLAPAAIGLLAVAGCAYLGVEDPNDPNALLPRCPTKLITGLDCPACGGLRMVRALTGGQWSAALHANLFLLVLTPFAVAVWLRWFVSGLTGGSFEPRISRRTAYVILVVALVWTVVRNLPAWPLHPLA